MHADIIRNTLDQERRQVIEQLSQRVEEAKTETALLTIERGFSESLDAATYSGFFVYVLWGDDAETPCMWGNRPMCSLG